MNQKTLSAGKGIHQYFLLPDGKEDTQAFEPGAHYIGVDAVRWFVNKQGNIFQNHIASGTARISVYDEIYEAGLGTYELKAGEYTAPIFDRPLLNNRVFRGGNFSIKMFIQLIKEDKLLGALLRDLAKTSLNIADSAVNTVGSDGPSKVLTSAGQSLIKSVEQILNQGASPKLIFDPSGIEINLDLTKLCGIENYILLHRGSELENDKIFVKKVSQSSYEVFYDGQLLTDGSWCLLRIRRESKYGQPRPWEKKARSLRNELTESYSRWVIGGLSKTNFLKQLKPSNQSPPSIGDRFLLLASQIRQDWTLTETEAIYRAGLFQALLINAQGAVNSNSPKQFDKANDILEKDIEKGKGISNPKISKIFEKEHEIQREIRKTPEQVSIDKYWNFMSNMARKDFKKDLIEVKMSSLIPNIEDYELKKTLLSERNIRNREDIRTRVKDGLKGGGFTGGGF